MKRSKWKASFEFCGAQYAVGVRKADAPVLQDGGRLDFARRRASVEIWFKERGQPFEHMTGRGSVRTLLREVLRNAKDLPTFGRPVVVEGWDQKRSVVYERAFARTGVQYTAVRYIEEGDWKYYFILEPQAWQQLLEAVK